MNLRGCIDSAERLLRCKGVWDQPNIAGPLFWAAVTQLLVYLNDLVREADRLGRRISDAPEIDGADDVKDLTDLIIRCRNAACHSPSQYYFLGGALIKQVVVAGRASNVIDLGSRALGSDYDDDVAVFFGGTRLYLRRHAMFALDRAKTVLADQAVP